MSCVLTLALDDASQERFEHERRRHFPPALNRIPAHLTLFHTLPEDDSTAETLRLMAGSIPAFPLDVTGVQSLGRGAAFTLASPALKALHGALRAAFEPVLSRQDSQGFRPHVVAQNKVSPAVAGETLALLQAEFAPWQGTGVGLDLWRYLDGPWLHLERFPFIAALNS